MSCLRRAGNRSWHPRNRRPIRRRCTIPEQFETQRSKHFRVTLVHAKPHATDFTSTFHVEEHLSFAGPERIERMTFGAMIFYAALTGAGGNILERRPATFDCSGPSSEDRKSVV